MTLAMTLMMQNYFEPHHIATLLCRHTLFSSEDNVCSSKTLWAKYLPLDSPKNSTSPPLPDNPSMSCCMKPSSLVLSVRGGFGRRKHLISSQHCQTSCRHTFHQKIIFAAAKSICLLIHPKNFTSPSPDNSPMSCHRKSSNVLRAKHVFAPEDDICFWIRKKTLNHQSPPLSDNSS